MEGGGSSSGGNKGKTKTTGTRRTWNPREEAILMDLLKSLVANGHWKTENGFRPGYLQKLGEAMREKIPGTDLRASPHINLRITIWKRHHSSIQTTLGDSGGAFNSVTKILDVSDDVWAKAVRKEPTVSGMRYKPWPFYYDWIEVFGCDRATGKACEDVMDAVNELIAEDTQARVGETVPIDNDLHMEEDVAAEMDVESQCPTIETGKPSSSNTKKRTSSLGSENADKVLFDGLSVLFKESDDKMEKMVEKIVVDTHGDHSTQGLFNIIETIVPDLSLDELLDASENLSNNPRRLAMFLGFPEHARPRYVRRLLKGNFDKP